MVEDLVPVVAVLSPFVFVICLIWLILHYRDRRRKHESSSPAIVAGAELERLADRMEKRIDALERILDVEAPGWRKKHHEH